MPVKWKMMTSGDLQKQRTGFSRAMTVANIRDQTDSEYVEVMFLESARFYKLSTDNSSFQKIMERLRDALAKRHVLNVRLASPDSDVIEEVEITG